MAVFLYQFFIKPKYSKDVNSEDARNHQASNELINILQKTVKVLEEKMEKKDKEFNDVNERLKVLEKDHTLVKDILKDRDPDSVKFRQIGMEAFAKISHINDNLVHANTKLIMIDNNLNNIRKEKIVV